MTNQKISIASEQRGALAFVTGRMEVTGKKIALVMVDRSGNVGQLSEIGIAGGAMALVVRVSGQMVV